jgi:hypothetical protein
VEVFDVDVHEIDDDLIDINQGAIELASDKSSEVQQRPTNFYP